MLVTNFTSWADPVRQENPQQTKGPPTSGEYINNFDSVKYIRIISQVFSVRPAVNFSPIGGNRLHPKRARAKRALRGSRCRAIFADCRHYQTEDDEFLHDCWSLQSSDLAHGTIGETRLRGFRYRRPVWRSLAPLRFQE